MTETRFIKLFPFLFFLLISTSIFAQDITGQWNGLLKVQGTQLRIVFNITKSATGFQTTMDSPDQGAKGIPVKETVFEQGELRIVAPNMGLTYVGKLNAGQTITGNFKQGAQSFPLTLSRESINEKPSRPQVPVEPYPYYSEEVQFENKAVNLKLSGTLTLPNKEGVFPAVILISGSGPQNRDEEIFGHQPFLVLADYLTKNGIAVLRYDDRGVGKSEGNFSKSTTHDFASDVEGAFAYLKTRKEINVKKIGLIGHSEGGLIAPMVAAKNKDVAFIVLLAGPGVPIAQLMLLQKEQIERQMGQPEAELKKGKEMLKTAYKIIGEAKNNDDALKAKLNAHFKAIAGADATDQDVNKITNQITSTWMFDFLRIDPKLFLKDVRVPVLALNGELDLQVSPKENLSAIQTILTGAGNKKVTTKEFPTLNHLFQESKTGAMTEYGEIEQTISPAVLAEILGWLKVQVK